MFLDARTFARRARAVNERARSWGARGFRSPATYRNLDWISTLEFDYDSSVSDTAPYEPQPGGCASWYPYFVGRMVEMPITVPQDHTLFGVLGNEDAAVWRAKLDEIEAAHGMACVLTHPDPDVGYLGVPENQAHYEEVLDRVAGSDAWCPLPHELVAWWRKRAGLDAEHADESSEAAFGTAVLDQRCGAVTLRSP
jgi:hypothetical protein